MCEETFPNLSKGLFSLKEGVLLLTEGDFLSSQQSWDRVLWVRTQGRAARTGSESLALFPVPGGDKKPCEKICCSNDKNFQNQRKFN